MFWGAISENKNKQQQQQQQNKREERENLTFQSFADVL